MFQRMSLLRYIGGFIVVLLAANVSFGQYDLAVSWNEYTEGETTDDDPFLGSFTIENVGESTILTNDTLWYGYIIDGEIYDLDLNLGLVSGEVLDDDFLPGDEISILNTFTWPLWGPGITIEACAVVFGVGYESYTGDLYTGDEDSSNNKVCINAVLPDYSVGIETYEAQSALHIYSNANEVVVVNNINEAIPAQISIAGINGQIFYQADLNLNSGQNSVQTTDFASGVYFISIIHNGIRTEKKLVIS